MSYLKQYEALIENQMRQWSWHAVERGEGAPHFRVFSGSGEQTKPLNLSSNTDFRK